MKNHDEQFFGENLTLLVMLLAFTLEGGESISNLEHTIDGGALLVLKLNQSFSRTVITAVFYTLYTLRPKITRPLRIKTRYISSGVHHCSSIPFRYVPFMLPWHCFGTTVVHAILLLNLTLENWISDG